MNAIRRRSVGTTFNLALLLFFFAICSPAQVTVQIGQNFTATTDNIINPIMPPDANSAIGPQHFVEFINGSFTVFNKTNGQSIQRITDLEFWTDAGVSIASDATVSDPRIIFDPTSQRWFASQVDTTFTSDDPTVYANHFLLAVSTSSNPIPNIGAWQAFKFTSDPDLGYFADFPTLGIDSNAVYLSGDFYNADTNEIGPGLVTIPKADLLAATPTIANRTWSGVMDYTVRGQVVQPAICFDGSVSGALLAMGDIGTDSNPHSNMVMSVVQNAGSTNATLSAPISIPVSPYVVPYNSDQGYPVFTALQPDGTTTLQANDARLSAKVYAVRGVLYAVHNTELNNHIAIRWYRINAATHTVLESGTISDPNLDLYFPSIAANNNGTVVIAYNGSSGSTYISCYAVAGQTVNGVTTFGAPILLKSGVDDYHDLNEVLGQYLGEIFDSRWGDYSSLSVDPSDPNRFWSLQMYPLYAYSDPNLGFGLWGTQATELLTIPPQPQLAIAPSGTNMVVSWPLPSTNYQLQSTTNLAAGNAWSPVTLQASTNGNQISVSVPFTGSQMFFRLVQ